MVKLFSTTLPVLDRSWRCGPTQPKWDKSRTASFAVSRTVQSTSALTSPAGESGPIWGWKANSFTLRKFYYTGSRIFHLHFTWVIETLLVPRASDIWSWTTFRILVDPSPHTLCRNANLTVPTVPFHSFILLPREESRTIHLHNKGALPVSWRLQGIEELGDEFTVPQSFGIVGAASSFPLTLKFKSRRPLLARKNLRLEVKERKAANIF